MEYLFETGARFLEHAETALLAVLNPNDRLFALYLLTSGLIAFFIYRSAAGRKVSEETTFLGFLFPKKVWSHPSAWLDLRYFIFHGVFGKFFLLGLGAATVAGSFQLVSGGIAITDLPKQQGLPVGSGLAVSLGFMFFSMLISDFLGWFCHYLQHKSPLLWQFHKVHHSAEVMHPVSNYREHPVDNFTYIVVISAGYGATMALTLRFLGYVPNVPTLIGVPLMMLVFNLVGYNLRHSHVWLRWPGKLAMIFPSPAHHHVHHSSHPDHIDKNFAFMFPIWDVIFKTYEMPKDNADVKFGIGEGNADELTSCLRLYWVPFRDAYRVITAQVKGEDFNMSKPEPVKSQKIHPAE